MADLVNASAQAIADALAPTPQAPAARWRWGSVVSVNADGTMNVSIGGATVPSIRCAQHVMGAQVGDRVRVLYCGTEAMVDAVRASSALMSVPSPSMDADTQAAWLDALGLGFSEGEVTAESAWTPYWSWLKKKSGTVSCTIQGQLKNQIAAWSNFSVQIATLPDGYRPSDYYNFLAIAQVSNSPIPVLMQVTPAGGVYVRTFGTALPASTWMWMGFTYFAA